MNTINKPTENMGGLIKIWAVPSGTFFVNGKIVTFSSTTGIYEIYCSPDTMQHSEPTERTNAGLVYKTEVTGFSPGDSEAARAAFANMDGRKYVAIFIDGNGNYRLAGGLFSPLQFYASFSTGRNTADRAGHEILFTGLTLEKATVINNPF
jgi:hypothetical protein